MVLGLGSKSKKKSKNVEESHRVVRTPSLPEFSTGVLPWPENLVDIQAVRDENTPPTTPQGAAKTSFSIPAQARSTIAFHRPFRLSESSNGHTVEPLRSPTGTGGQPGAQSGIPGVPPIASLFVSQHPPSAFDLHARSGTYPGSGSRSAKTRISQRRAKIPPTFNVMVAGAQGLGKTSLLRLLIDTADISPTASVEQIASMDRFLRVTGRRTTRIETATIEICESRFDRLSLTIIDTPGLDFQEGRELKLDRQVSAIVKYLDLQYADTMDEESKVVRRSKGDQHVHLCIYLVDPETVVSPSARRALSSFPNGSSTATLKTADGATPAADAQEDDVAQERISMSPTEIRIIKRLSSRVNVLPVVARSDVLTDDKLAAVKVAVKRDLQEAGLGFGVFMSPKLQSVEEDEEAGNESTLNESTTNGHENGNASVEGTEAETHEGTAEKDEDEDDGGRQSRPVIKLRHSKRDTSRRSRSRSRVTLIEANRGEHEPLSPDATDADSVANVRFSAHILAQNTRMEELLPFALIMPEQTPGRRRALKQPPPLSRPQSEYIPDSVATAAATNGDAPMPMNGGTEVSAKGADGMLASPVDPHSETRSLNKKFLAVPYTNGPPRDLKGVFLRKFRWGTVDVLNPAHCDFAALRTSIFSTHLKVLKTNTREVLYEKYRTEKLLARRATRNISQQDHKMLLEGL